MPPDRQTHLDAIASEARAAEERGDGWTAGEAWKRYELVRDAGRDPNQLLAEGVALSRVALDLAGQAERSEV